MPAEQKETQKTDTGGMGSVVAVAAVMAAIVAVPVALGVALFLAVRQWLGKREAWAMVLVGVAGLVLAGQYVLSTYGTWLSTALSVITKDVSATELITNAPWLAFVLLATLVAGTLSLLTGTKLGSKFGSVLPQHTRLHRNRGLFTKSGHVDEETLLDREKREAVIAHSNVVAPPGGALHVDAAVHSIVDAAAAGSRSFPIGIDAQGQPVYLNEGEIGTHGLILGATGSGKSETIKALIGCLLDLGWDGLLLDLKEDLGLRNWCATYAQVHGTQFQELRLSDANSPYWFNALHGMGPDEMRDAILSLQEFEAAYYEALNKELLGQLINLMYWAHLADPSRFAYPTMYDVAKICGSASLNKSTQAMRAVVLAAVPGTSEKDFLVLTSPSKAQQDSAVGFGSRLGNIFDSQAGRTVLRNDAEGSRMMVDVTNPGLTYIGLDSQGKQDLTRVVSSSVLQRLSVYAAQRTVGAAKKDRPRFVVVDEANWVNREITKNLLSRARSAGIALFLCTQGPNDWIDRNGDDWATLTQNINIAIIMRQGAPDSAVLCAEYLGKKMRQNVSERIDQTEGLFGERRVRDRDGQVVNTYNVSQELDYRVPPDTLRELTIGQAYMRIGAPDQRTTFVRILMRDPMSSPRR